MLILLDLFQVSLLLSPSPLFCCDFFLLIPSYFPQVTYDYEIEAYVTCMHVLQGTEFVALGHSNGNLTIHNILTSKIVRNISISSSPIIDILLRGTYLNILTKDAHDEIIFYQYYWLFNLYVENRLTN